MKQNMEFFAECLMLCASLTIGLFVTGCASISGATGAVQKPQQVISEFCPAAKAGLAPLIAAAPNLTPNAQKAIAKAADLIDGNATTQIAGVCTLASAASLAELTSLPGIFAALQSVVPLVTTDPKLRSEYAIGLALAATSAQAIVASLPQATPALASSTIPPAATK
jgi:hypothetical protein